MVQGQAGVHIRSRSTFTAALAAAIVLALVLTAVPVSATEEWQQLDDMPFETVSFCTAQLPDGKVFFNGGQKEGGTDNSDETWLYDPSTDTWEGRAASPLALAGASAVYMPDGCVYVLLGKDSNGLWDHGLMVYDVVGDSWTENDYIGGLGYHREAAAIDDFRILIAGGLVSHPMLPTDECIVYDIRYEQYLPAEPLPYSVGLGCLIRAGGSMFYIGGYDAQNVQTSLGVLRYDILAGDWEVYGQMANPSAGAEGVLGGDGLVHLYGNLFNPDQFSSALDLRDCSIRPSQAVPVKSVNGGIAATSDGRVIVFGGESDNTVSREVHSLTLYEKETWLGSDATGPGTTVRVYASFEAVCFANEGMTATAYLVKDDVTYASCLLSAVGNGTASGLMDIPEDLQPGTYQVLIEDVDTGVGIAGMIEFDALSLSVTEAPSPTDRLGELQDQLSQLRDELNGTRAELADLKESVDGKMDATVGYVLLGMMAVVLVAVVLQMVRKR